MEKSEEDLWQEILAKEASAERLYDVYRQARLAATLVRMTYAREYGHAPHLQQFDQS